MEPRRGGSLPNRLRPIPTSSWRFPATRRRLSRIATGRDPARPRPEQTHTTRRLRPISAWRTAEFPLPSYRRKGGLSIGSEDRGQTGLTASFRQTAPKTHVSHVSPLPDLPVFGQPPPRAGSGVALLCPYLCWFRTLACIVPWIWIGCPC